MRFVFVAIAVLSVSACGKDPPIVSTQIKIPPAELVFVEPLPLPNHIGKRLETALINERASNLDTRDKLEESKENYIVLKDKLAKDVR